MNNPLLLRTLLAGATLLGAAFAQNPDGPYWSEYPVPAGESAFRSIGTLAYSVTPTAIHFYSGLHRQWLVQPVTSAIVHGTANAYCLFQDGNDFHAYCTRTHRVASITTSGSASWSIGSPQSSWTCYVQDGNTVYGWSGFLGQWVPLTVQGNLHTVAVNSHSLLVADDVNLYGFSAFFGDWVATPNRSGGQYAALRSGAVATYSAPDETVCFSAYQNTWNRNQSFVDPQSALRADQEGYLALRNNGDRDVLWYSTMTGTFEETHEPVGVVASFARNCAIYSSPTGTFGYAPTQGTLVPLPGLNPNPLVVMASGNFGSYGFVDDGVQTLAFSGLTGTFAATPTYTQFAYQLGDAAGIAEVATGGGYAYSAMLGQWFAAPATTSLVSTVSYEAVVRQTANGFEAFSARSGAWRPLVSTGYRVGGGAGSLIVVMDGQTAQAFDPILDEWVGQPVSANATANVFRLTGIVYDDAEAFGYSLFTHSWDRIALQDPPSTAAANSSIAYVNTGNHHYVFTANGSLSNFSRFPEFSRFVVRGGRLEHLQCGNPGAFVVGLFGFQGGRSTTPYGTLYLEPNPIAITLGLVPAHGQLRASIPVPNDPVWSGLVMHMQDFVVRPNGTAFLSNHQAPYLW